MNKEISTFDTEDDFLPQNERPVFLKVLCILSWINAGWWILYYTLFKLFVTKEITSMVIEKQKSDELKKLYELEFYIIEKTAFIFLLLYLTSVVVVYMIWEMKKLGFKIYVPLHLLIMLIPYFVIPFSISHILFPLIYTLGFIGMYASNSKYMKS